MKGASQGEGVALPMKSDESFYGRRIARVVRHIAEHLDDDLSTESLSAVAGFSPFHFQRQFRAYTGVTPGKLVRLLRLKQASYQLAVETDARVLDIALDAGFDAPESFCRAFKRAQGQSPSAFRRAPDWATWAQVFCDDLQAASWSDAQIGEQEQPNFVDFPETRIAMLMHRGPPSDLMHSVLRFIDWRRSSGLCPPHGPNPSMTLGIAYDDPDVTPDVDYRFGIAASLPDAPLSRSSESPSSVSRSSKACSSQGSAVPENDHGVVEALIPGGRCAVVTHRGSTASLGDTVRALYAKWLPRSEASLRDFPCFLHYKVRAPSVAECDQVTVVYLPIL